MALREHRVSLVASWINPLTPSKVMASRALLQTWTQATLPLVSTLAVPTAVVCSEVRTHSKRASNRAWCFSNSSSHSRRVWLTTTISWVNSHKKHSLKILKINRSRWTTLWMSWTIVTWCKGSRSSRCQYFPMTTTNLKAVCLARTAKTMVRLARMSTSSRWSQVVWTWHRVWALTRRRLRRTC